MMRATRVSRMCCVAVTVLAVCILGAADAAAQPLADRARGLPPQLKADVLIRVADSGKIRSSRVVSDLLEEAFYAAEGAEEPVKLDLTGGDRYGLRDYIRARSRAGSTGCRCRRAPCDCWRWWI